MSASATANALKLLMNHCERLAQEIEIKIDVKAYKCNRNADTYGTAAPTVAKRSMAGTPKLHSSFL